MSLLDLVDADRQLPRLLRELGAGARFAALEGLRALRAHAREVAAPLLALVALHVLVEFVVPSLWPRAYECMTRRRRRRRLQEREQARARAVQGGQGPGASPGDAGKANAPSSSSAAAAAVTGAEEEKEEEEKGRDLVSAAVDARTRVMSGVFASYVSVLALAALASGDAARLQRDPFASTPLTEHLMRVAVAFFAYDVVVVLSIDFGPASLVWLAHGGLCLWVFACSLQPFLHYMGLVTLLFELSTPFLHLRIALLDSGLERSALFGAANVLFGLCFAASRICFGCYKIFAPGQWWSQMEALVATAAVAAEREGAETSASGGGGGEPRLRGVSIVRGYQVCAVLLTMLNFYWFSVIAGRFFQARESDDGKEEGGAAEPSGPSTTAGVAAAGGGAAASARLRRKPSPSG